MRVLMLTRTLPPHGQGGLAASAWDLAHALAGAGAQVRVLAPAGAATSSADRLVIQTLDAPPGRYSTAWWRGSLRAYDRLGGERFDVVLGVSAAANALAARRRSSGAGARADAPLFVFQAHGTSAGEIVSKLRRPGPRLRPMAGAVRSLYWGLARDRAYRDYDAVVAVGEAVRRQLAAWPTRRLVGDTPLHLVRNGVDPAGFRFDPQARRRLRASLGLHETAPLALFVGRLQADKGLLQALEAVRRALPQRPALGLVFAGDGPERRRLEQRTAALGLQGRVHGLGHLPRGELRGWLSAADALLFPTRRVEGLPLIVLEALACGLPVLTTPQGAGDPELPCRRLDADDAPGFAAALAGLSTAQPRASQLPATFHLDHSARAYLALFERLLGERGTFDAARRAA